MVQEQAPSIKFTLLYIAVTGGSNIDAYAPRFARTYLEHPPGYPHKLVVVINGGALTERRAAYFKGTHCQFWEHENHGGWDVGAYVDYAQTVADKDEILVCLGESIYFHRAGWLQRIAESYSEYGSGMYGFFSSHMVRAHLNTTGFSTDARLLAQYHRILNHGARYEFEHGHKAYWKRIAAGGHTAALVTFDNIWFQGEWRDGQNIMHRGDQSNLLAFCNHTEKWANADPNTKKMWSTQSDSVFRV
jgi:hypothetical protein